MNRFRRIRISFVQTLIVCSTTVLSLSFHLQAAAEPVSDQLANFLDLTDQAYKDVSEMTGLPYTEPVKVEMITRNEVVDFIRRTTAIEYPDDELVQRGRCLAEFGFLPQDYDLTEGMIGLVGEQAGAIYDQHSKTLLGISDLPHYLYSTTMQRMLISHEVCHALEDRQVDITARYKAALTDMDGEYAFRSAIEGMATVVMLAYCHNLDIDNAPDARATMRNGFSQNKRNKSMPALAATPLYLSESLISPYAEGGAFAQEWLRANEGAKLGAMLSKMPTTSEQVLHFDKYVKGDAPTSIDLSPAASVLPEGWTSYYTNTLGEFDLRTLFASQEKTKSRADKAAEGWDGFRFAAYSDSLGRLLTVGCSVWDSESDANEFSDAFEKVLEETRDSNDFSVLQAGSVVSFAIGPTDRETATRLAEVLAEAVKTQADAIEGHSRAD